jgi:hypothetical protein
LPAVNHVAEMKASLPQPISHRGLAFAPRLLTRKQAAAYCGVSVHTLTRHCPIKPIALGNSKRLERYDVHQLDKWIDTFDEGDTTVNKDWLAALDEDDDSRAHQGN